MRQSYYSKQFKKDYKKAKKTYQKDLHLLRAIMKDLIFEKPVQKKYKDHLLKGNYKNRRELHLKPDWLLIYKLGTNAQGKKSVYFERIGSHGELFK